MGVDVVQEMHPEWEGGGVGMHNEYLDVFSGNFDNINQLQILDEFLLLYFNFFIG